MSLFFEKIKNRESGIILYGLTPPKAHNPEEKILAISQKVASRLEPLGVDGLVIYDIQDESSRNNDARPFPFAATIDPLLYADNYLKDLKLPKIVYKSVGKSNTQELECWIKEVGTAYPVVFVGAPSKNEAVGIKLPEAYEVWNKMNPVGLLGGVAIPERHNSSRNEHTRIAGKIKNGCSFFISQCVYNSSYTKNVLSDLYYYCLENRLQMPTFIFTLTTCGSVKTLEFMNWLGIDIPVWLSNELHNSRDILSRSADLCIEIAEDLTDFCLTKQIPFGVNIESVSVRPEEIEASVYLLNKVKKVMEGAGVRGSLVQ
ncbi:MAG: methylenetetrahydrofolate reductase [Cytophagaceae bacterium]